MATHKRAQFSAAQQQKAASARRWSTRRYLCLLAILLHPTPPPLICLEEPELDLHPDAVVAVDKPALRAVSGLVYSFQRN